MLVKLNQKGLSRQLKMNFLKNLETTSEKKRSFSEEGKMLIKWNHFCLIKFLTQIWQKRKILGQGKKQ